LPSGPTEAAPSQADDGLKRSKRDVRLRLAQPFEKAQIVERINLDFPSLFLDFLPRNFENASTGLENA
jgi:hypothetical protein